MGCPGAHDGVVEPHSQGGQGPGYAMDPVASRQGCELSDGVVHLGAYSVRTGYFPEHLGDLRVHGGGAVVDECTHEGHCCLLALRWHPCEPQGPVILQAVPQGVEGVPRPVLRDLDRGVVQVARGVGVVGDERGDVLRHPPPPRRIARMTSCTTFGGTRVLGNQWCTAARRRRCLRFREKSPSGCS